MVRNLALNVRDVVGRMSVIMLLRSSGGEREGRRVNLMMRMKRAVWVVRTELRLPGMRVEWVRGRGLHKDIALMLRFSVCMYQHLFQYYESTVNVTQVSAHEAGY